MYQENNVITHKHIKYIKKLLRYPYNVQFLLLHIQQSPFLMGKLKSIEHTEFDNIIQILKQGRIVQQLNNCNDCDTNRQGDSVKINAMILSIVELLKASAVSELDQNQRLVELYKMLESFNFDSEQLNLTKMKELVVLLGIRYKQKVVKFNTQIQKIVSSQEWPLHVIIWYIYVILARNQHITWYSSFIGKIEKLTS